MAIDESIYGGVEDWDVYCNGGNPDPDLQVYCLHTYLSQHAQTPIGSPIDKSLACSGLGVESVFSDIKWYYTGDIDTAGVDIEPSFTDKRPVTNWCFGDSHIPYSGSASEYNQKGSVIIDGDTEASSTPPAFYRYAPEPASDPYVPTLWLNASNIKPITQFSHKNLVALIYVDVSDTLGDYLHQHTYTLKDYLEGSNVKETYPYIYNVSIRLFIDNGNASTIQRMTVNNINACAVAPLDYVNLPVTKPYMYNLVSGSGEYIKIMGGFPSQSGVFKVRGSANVNNKTYIGACVTDAWKVHITSVNVPYQESQGYVYRQYDGTFKEEVFRQVACFGLLFTDDVNVARYADITDENMYCGVLDEHLIGHGDYTSGEDNENNEQIKWTNSNDSTYDPSYEPRIDPNTYGISTSFNAVTLSNGTLKRYVLDATGMTKFGEHLWDIIDTTEPDALIQNQTLTNFLTNNPLDCIVSLKRFPLPNELMPCGAQTTITLGKVTVPNTEAYPFAITASTIHSCGNKYVFPIFSDWRDYLCQYTLVLPFCGSVSLPPEIVVGKWIEVLYGIDFTTGTCTAWVLCELDDGSDVVIDSACGNCSIDIPISGVQTADLMGQIYNANENLKAMKFNNMIDGTKGGMTFIKNIAEGNNFSAIQSGLSLGQHIVNSIHDQSVAEWNMNNTQVPLKMIGSSSGCNSFQHELRPRLIIYYPVNVEGYKEEDYAHTVGFQCCETTAIKNRTGYAEINNVDLSGFSATATEKSMIQSLLAGGVWL